MKNIVQTLPYEVFNEAQKINQLFEAGIDILHIRKPLYSTQEMFDLIIEIDSKYHDRIVIHNHFKLLNKFNLKGIHSDLSDINNFFKRQYLSYLKSKYDITLSVTVSKLNATKVELDIIDYVFVGPIFQKFSEETIIQKLNLFELKKEIDICSKEIFGQGCFNLNNIFAINASGFSGPVLQSYIWKSEDILNSFKVLQLNLQKFDKTGIEKKLTI